MFPKVIQKYLLDIIIDHYRLNEYSPVCEIRNCALVNWEWFNYLSIFTSRERIIGHDVLKIKKYVDGADKNNDSQLYQFIKYDKIQYLMLEFFQIDQNAIYIINNDLVDLKKVTLIQKKQSEKEDHVKIIWNMSVCNKILIDLNQLRPNLDINVDFFINSPSRINIQQNFLQESVRFQTNDIKLKFYYQEHAPFDEFILCLKPKSIYLQALELPDKSKFHIPWLHTLSISNRFYEKVVIKDDYLPLFALLRFLQSPNLHSFKFQLQFHMLYKLYSSTEGFVHQEIVQENHDDYTFCSHYKQQRMPSQEIPPFYRAIWNQCLKLLTFSSTLKNLSISDSLCFCDSHSELTVPLDLKRDFTQVLCYNTSLENVTFKNINFISFEMIKEIKVFNKNLNIKLK
ncbi:hypothetical protein CYY_003284 [Polysphondylium violaceum]|uniref:Uncharacterized protein n=1 Tax=Polysphondylium violaceum TaxID=133409 RepID=A0A8J4V0A9_9MYCE|nr:hypothetical protein CYY_003284 [Polysphondylium violaceum]